MRPNGYPPLSSASGPRVAFRAESRDPRPGSCTATLTFIYTVRGSDRSAHLDYAPKGALTLNGGTNNASLTLSAPGATGSLGANTSIVIGSSSAMPAFFTGHMSLGSGVYYLQFPDGNPFGFFTFPSSSIFYHYDMGWYMGPSLFPDLYDFDRPGQNGGG